MVEGPLSPEGPSTALRAVPLPMRLGLTGEDRVATYSPLALNRSWKGTAGTPSTLLKFM
jgi:hypothetical protein